MKLEELAGKCGEWLRGSGPESDIVISSRIRLARNLAEFPFIRKCTDQDRAQIERTLRDRIQDVQEWSGLAPPSRCVLHLTVTEPVRHPAVEPSAGGSGRGGRPKQNS